MGMIRNANASLINGLKEDLKLTPGNWSRIIFLPPSPAKVFNLRAIADGAEVIKTGITSMYPGRKAYRVETFEEAIKRLALDEAHLKDRRGELLFESRIMYLLAFVSIVGAGYFAATDLPAGVFCALCSWLIGTTGGFCRAFRVDQIDRRELYAFPAFWRRPEGWFK